jgi:hypothetical protein
VIYGEESAFADNPVFYDTIVGPSVGNLTGYFNNSQIVVQLINGTQTGVSSVCQTLTPTPTTTSTPTNTPTQTSSPTPTFAYYTYSLGYDATLASTACSNFPGSTITVYGTVAQGSGPTVGDTLYETPGIPLTDEAPDGYYSNGTAWFLISGGSGLITSQNITGCP